QTQQPATSRYAVRRVVPKTKPRHFSRHSADVTAKFFRGSLKPRPNNARDMDAESGAGEQTIMDIAGHVSRQMLARYSHIRTEAKRKALEGIVSKPAPAPQAPQPTEEQKPAG